MAVKEWSTNYPTSQDTGTDGADQQPDLVNGEDDTRVSQIHTMRKKAHELAQAVGDASNLPAGCLKARVTALEGGGGPTTLCGMTDVDCTGINDGDFLRYNDKDGDWSPWAFDYGDLSSKPDLGSDRHRIYSNDGDIDTNTPLVSTTSATYDSLLSFRYVFDTAVGSVNVRPAKMMALVGLRVVGGGDTGYCRIQIPTGTPHNLEVSSTWSSEQIVRGEVALAYGGLGIDTSQPYTAYAIDIALKNDGGVQTVELYYINIYLLWTKDPYSP